MQAKGRCWCWVVLSLLRMTKVVITTSVGLKNDTLSRELGSGGGSKICETQGNMSISDFLQSPENISESNMTFSKVCWRQHGLRLRRTESRTDCGQNTVMKQKMREQGDVNFVMAELKSLTSGHPRRGRQHHSWEFCRSVVSKFLAPGTRFIEDNFSTDQG